MSLILQQNPALDKISVRLGRAGSGDLSPILSGFGGKLTLPLSTGETLTAWKFVWDSGSFDIFADSPTYDVSTNTYTYSFVFGTESASDSSAAGKRNYLEWTTTIAGETGSYTFRRQFYGKDVPTKGAIYVANQEAQESEAIVNFSMESGEADEHAGNISLAFNILPTVNDEFFAQGEYVENRYANTRRNWGGAATCQVSMRKSESDSYEEIISETVIENIMGYFWTPNEYGLHSFRFRLRSVMGSANYIDVIAKVRAQRIPCP